MTKFEHSANITRDKFDFIIILILVLIIAVVIGYNILKFFNYTNDNKKNQIKLNDVVSTVTNEKENFGNIKDYPDSYSNDTTHILSGVINSDTINLNVPDKYKTATNPNYNTVNDPPLLFDPDPDVPNKAGPDAKGYYFTKVKLVEDPNSPLMKLYKKNLNNINKMVAKCTLADTKRVPEINGTFDGYNAFVDLKTDSFANVTSIGKSMLTPYTSYPVPS